MHTSDAQRVAASKRLPDFEARSVALFAALARGGALAPPQIPASPASEMPVARSAAPSNPPLDVRLLRKRRPLATTGL